LDGEAGLGIEDQGVDGFGGREMEFEGLRAEVAGGVKGDRVAIEGQREIPEVGGGTEAPGGLAGELLAAGLQAQFGEAPAVIFG